MVPRGWHLADFHAPALSACSNSGIKDKSVINIYQLSTDFSLQKFYQTNLNMHQNAYTSDVRKSATCYGKSWLPSSWSIFSS